MEPPSSDFSGKQVMTAADPGEPPLYDVKYPVSPDSIGFRV